MNEFFFSKDALQNYFSESIGIIITVILIPIIIRISNRNLNSTKRHLAKKILFKLTTDYLDILAPNKIRIEKAYIHSKRFDIYITPFDLESDFWQTAEKYLMRKLKKKNEKELKEEIIKMTESFKSIYSELSDFYSNYGSILSNNINKIYFQINFNIMHLDPADKIDKDLDLDFFIETWLSLLFSINNLREILLKGLNKKELKEGTLFYKPNIV